MRASGARFSGGAALLGAAASLLLGGCPGGPAAPPPRPVDAPDVTISVADGLEFGATADVAVVVKNTTSVPMALVGVVVKHGGSLTARREPSDLAATLDAEGKGALAGTLTEEDIGPAARMPAPPKWSFAGEQRIASMPILAPGAATTTEGKILIADDAARSVEATIFYAALPTGCALVRIDSPVIEPVPPESGPPAASGGAGFPRKVVAARAKASLSRAAAPSPDAALPLSWAGPQGPEAGLLAPPPLFPCALRMEDANRFAVRGAQLTRVLAIKRPAFDAPDARAKVRFPACPALYLAPAQAWLLERAPLEKGETAAPGEDRRAALVTAEKVVRSSGRLAPLVSRLVESETAPLLLFGRAPSQDPDGLGVFLEGKGFAVSYEAEKGGTHRAVVTVERKKLVALLEALGEKGLTIDEARVVRAE